MVTRISELVEVSDAICPQKHEKRACASSLRHILSCCYRGWDHDQMSLVRNW